MFSRSHEKMTNYLHNHPTTYTSKKFLENWSETRQEVSIVVEPDGSLPCAQNLSIKPHPALAEYIPHKLAFSTFYYFRQKDTSLSKCVSPIRAPLTMALHPLSWQWPSLPSSSCHFIVTYWAIWLILLHFIFPSIPRLFSEPSSSEIFFQNSLIRIL